MTVKEYEGDPQVKQEILLESGTNEFEILEFILRDQSFGVNVAKINQIMQFDPERATVIPEAPDAMMGVYLHRDGTIPLIDLGKALGMKSGEPVEKPLVMVCEFNQIMCGLYIDGVKRIHRMSWTDIQPMNSMLAKESASIISSASIDQTEVLIVDLEHIMFLMGLVDAPKLEEEQPKLDQDKPVRIILAEDSNFIRSQMLHYLNAGGYSNVEGFANGQLAYDAVKAYMKEAEKNKAPITDYFNFVITDIEMPQMDGLTFCRLLKEHPVTKKVPIAIYSSLINEQMEIKCRQVGADYHMCKPAIGDLLRMLHKTLTPPQAISA